MIGREELERQFSLFEAAAVKGERCPLSKPFGPINQEALRLLIAEGRVRSEVSSKNYRRVVILTGPHAGKGTLPDPGRGEVWKVNGVRVRRLQPMPVRGQPSAPQALKRTA